MSGMPGRFLYPFRDGVMGSKVLRKYYEYFIFLTNGPKSGIINLIFAPETAQGGLLPMRSNHSFFIRGIALAVTLLLLIPAAMAAGGQERDEDGGIWDWDNGTYTTADGRVFSISTNDEAYSGDLAPEYTVPGETLSEEELPAMIQNEDGSVIITNNGEDIIRNEDGSIEVESGQIQIIEAPKEDAMTGDEVWAKSMRNAAINNGAYTPTFYVNGYGGMDEVGVEYMGIYRSMIQVNGEYVLVPTSYLSWTTEAPEEKVLAVVTAKTYARLFEKSSKKSVILDKCYNGTVMRVLKTDKNWTMVDYKGIRGYVQTDSLRFYANEPREYRTGWVATRSGHTYGNSTVHVRNDPKGRQQEEYPVGTPITILEDDGKWCRIEVQGHMCYLLREFMVYEE